MKNIDMIELQREFMEREARFGGQASVHRTLIDMRDKPSRADFEVEI